ncbi:class E sortase [Saccharothrix sp. NPDC042600]|uniref:class E sortase n=1 Tax=Saccharothrix TaxID=2071 RepID=UPI0033F9E836|nr:class E sortase [Saccharothrix mutabilis subsp. capreolus]
MATTSPLWVGVRVVGDVLMNVGLAMVLFVAYETWGKVGEVDAGQHSLEQRLEQAWTPPGSPPTDADPYPAGAGQPPIVGRLHLPALGLRLVVVDGVSTADLRFAPGHYPDSAMPGEVGNMAVAGHRTPGIFWDLDRLEPGDVAVVETADRWYVHRVTGVRVVAPTAAEVVAPVPDRPGAAPTVAMLTLTTCNPKWDNYERLVVHARLDRVSDKTGGKPDELT